MIEIFWQFLIYNLLPAAAAGLALWLIIYAALELLHVRRGTLRLPLLYFPLIKSTLLLLGIGLMLPWPQAVFEPLADRSVAARQVLPALLLWGGAALWIRYSIVRRARRQLLARAQPAHRASARLSRAFERVQESYRRRAGLICGESLFQCRVRPSLPATHLAVTDRPLASPLVFTAEPQPTIVFPTSLLDELSDAELEGALAHEYAHVLVTRPFWCSEAGIKHLSPVSPVAGLIARYLRREEELACDEMAVLVTGDADSYAGMLLKSYRHGAGRQRFGGNLHVFSQLLGLQPEITERVERLLKPRPARSDAWLQRCAALGIWVTILSVFSLF